MIEDLTRISEFLISLDITHHTLDPSVIDAGHIQSLGPVKGWFVIETKGDGLLCVAKRWADGKTERLFTGAGTVSKLDEKAYRKRQRELSAKVKERHFEKKELAYRWWMEWAEHDLDGQSDYLTKKGLKQPVMNVITRANTNDNQRVLVIPMFDEYGDIWNLQQIYSKGEKRFVTGARKKGLFHVLNNGAASAVVYLGEGFATCLSVANIQGAPVWCAFDKTNLEDVLRLMLEKWSADRIVLLADYDGETYSKTGKNPGMLEAQKLSVKYRVRVAVPVKMFDFRQNVDFADLNQEERIERLGDLMSWEEISMMRFEQEKTISFAKTEDAEIAPEPVKPELPPPRDIVKFESLEQKFDLSERQLPLMNIPMDKNGKVTLPDEMTVVDCMLKYFKPYMVKSLKEVFVYNGKVWKVLEDDDFLFQMFSKVYQGKAGYRTLSNTISLFLKHLPKAPRVMQTPEERLTIFNNGTMLVENNKIVFRGSRYDDYVTNLVPHDFPLDQNEKNERFEQTLDLLVGPDPEIRRSIAQMFAACLAPSYPRLFMLVGKPGRGKSTILKLAVNLVSEENVSSVLPADFGSFLSETMLGKILNCDADIPSDQPINDAMLKKVEDAMKVTVNRKHQKAVRGKLPPIHIFGANLLPPTTERSIGAYERRWTFIKLDRFKAEGSNYTKHFADEIVDAGMGGVINFALRGLRDILDCGGHYFMTSEARGELTAWQRENDSVAGFLEDIANGSFPGIRAVAGGEILRSEMWMKYQNYLTEAHPHNANRLTRNRFFAALRQRDVPEGKNRQNCAVFFGYRMGK